MNVYLDEDSSARVLINSLRKSGHDVAFPEDLGHAKHTDPEVLRRAILLDRVLISQNHGDLEDLHDLLMAAGGHHPGILIVRRDNDPTRDFSPRGIVRAIEKLAQSGLAIQDNFYVLNQWR
jgi:predicted nuclease of predicted toxin-antitoxin system